MGEVLQFPDLTSRAWTVEEFVPQMAQYFRDRGIGEDAANDAARRVLQAFKRLTAQISFDAPVPNGIPKDVAHQIGKEIINRTQQIMWERAAAEVLESELRALRVGR